MKTDFVISYNNNKDIIPKTSNNAGFMTRMQNLQSTKLKPLEKDIVQFYNHCKPAIKGKNANIPMLQSEAEFKSTLDKLIQSPSYKWKSIKEAFDYEQAILPYAGRGDISSDINSYLRNGIIENPTYRDIRQDSIKEYIQILDFGLRKLDDEYGSYNGVVFRYGEFSAQTPNYISTSDKMEGAINFADKVNPCKKQYNIIVTKHGHKINKMQERLGLKFAQTESEILLDPDKSYNEITDPSYELENLRTKFYEEFKKAHPNANTDDLILKFWEEV